MAAAAKTIILITGANSGVGFELAAQLMAKGTYHVLMGCRSADKGRAALHDLEARNLPGTGELVELDVTDDDTIARAAAAVERAHGRLDLLVNNAAIAALEPPLRQQMRDALDTNATGPLLVTHALAPLLLRSKAAPPRIVNVTSGAGSIGRRLEPSSPMYKMKGGYQYRVSKAALGMVTACQWVEYGEAGVKVFGYDPGFTQSNLAPWNNAENGAKPASKAVMPLIDVLEGKRDDEAGQMLHDTGVYPW